MQRRTFLRNLGILSGSVWLAERCESVVRAGTAPLHRFKLGAISDGFSQDFEEALKMMKSYGLSWVEIRNVWGIYNTEATPGQIRRLKDVLAKYEFKVSVVDTALFKCTLPGTELVADEKDVYPYSGQMDLLKRAIDRAHAWGTDKLRIFTFWRATEPAKIATRIADELSKAAEVAAKAGIRLAIEDEGSTNVGTGRELAEILARVPAPNLGVNWDVGNGCSEGEAPFPDGYAALDKKRVWHLHVKGVTCDAGFQNCQETFADQGQIDLVGQFRALVRDGYEETLSLECEFEAPGLSHLATTRRSLEGLLRVIAAALG